MLLPFLLNVELQNKNCLVKMKLKITQTRSIIDRPKDQKKTIEALGLGRPNWVKIHNDTPQIRGMIRKVTHLLKVEEIKD